LAQAQAQEVAEALRRRVPGIEVTLRTISTRGDRDQRTALPDLGLGIFTREIEKALLAGEINVAVHSLKDLETQLPPGLAIGAVPVRMDPRDVLVSAGGRPMADLPAGARVGTGSPRRGALVRAMRPDLEVLSIRGNVGTRLAMLDRGEYEAVVLAAIGLARLGIEERVTQFLDPADFVPAVGQGALAVEVREDDPVIMDLVATIDHRDSRAAVTAERAFLRGLGGGCRVPIAAYGRVEGDRLDIVGLVTSDDGRRMHRASQESAVDEAEEAGRRLAVAVLAQGAGELLAAEELP
jgi:hydroxymethylbilane synthase